MEKKHKELLIAVKDKFDLSISFVKAKQEVKLPPIIKMEYDIELIKIEFIEFVLITPKHQESASIKRINMIQERYDKPLLYLSENIASPLKRDFLDAHISFVSNNMIYLYPLLLLQKDRGEFVQNKDIRNINISMQPLMLYILYNYRYDDHFSVEKIHSEFKQSVPTIYRYIQVLEDLSLLKVEKDGRNKFFQLNKDMSFEKMLKLLRSPVKEIVFIKHEDFQRINENHQYCVAGESSLCQYNLAVSQKSYAVFYNDTKGTEWDKVSYSSRYYDEYDEIQKWYYDPKNIKKMIKDSSMPYQDSVDPISLYLSLRDSDNDNDARVEDSIEQLFEEIKRLYGWQTI